MIFKKKNKRIKELEKEARDTAADTLPLLDEVSEEGLDDITKHLTKCEDTASLRVEEAKNGGCHSELKEEADD